MLVKYSLQSFPDKGKGLVAGEFIAKDTKLWEFREHNAKIFSSREELIDFLEGCPTESRLATLSHIYGMAGKAILMQDDSEYMNHSKNPNVHSNEEITAGFATRDIQPGEELTMNYMTLHLLDWLEQICEEYGTDTTKDVENYQ